MYLDYFPAGFITSFLLCLGLIFLDKKAAESGDINLRPTPQTFHQKSISRFGGVAVVLSMSFSSNNGRLRLEFFLLSSWDIHTSSFL